MTTNTVKALTYPGGQNKKEHQRAYATFTTNQIESRPDATNVLSRNDGCHVLTEFARMVQGHTEETST